MFFFSWARENPNHKNFEKFSGPLEYPSHKKIRKFFLGQVETLPIVVYVKKWRKY